MSANKYQILETITAVSRLITLAFKPKDTKIAIRDHMVILCEPTITSLYGIPLPQSVDRFINGDSREDIYILNKVICRFILWYIIPYKEQDKEIYNGLINMAKYLCIGLEHLQDTYKTGTVVGTLQYYILALIAIVNDTFDPNMLYDPSCTRNNSFLDDDLDKDIDAFNVFDESTVYSTIFDVDKFKNFWTKNELKSLIKQFEQCFRRLEEPDVVIFKEDADISTNIVSSSSNKSDNEENNDEVLQDISNDIQEPIRKIHRKKIIKDMNHETSGSPKNTKINKKYLSTGLFKIVPKGLNNVIVRGNLTGIMDI